MILYAVYDQQYMMCSKASCDGFSCKHREEHLLELIQDEIEERSSSQQLCTDLQSLVHEETDVQYETGSAPQVLELAEEEAEGVGNNCMDKAPDAEVEGAEVGIQGLREEIENQPIQQQAIPECCGETKSNRPLSMEGKSVLDIAVQAYMRERLQIHKVNG